MPTAGDRISDIRKKRVMTRDQLARTTGLSKSFLSEVENKNRNISVENLLKIANALGTSIQFLLEGWTKEPLESRTIRIPPELSKAAEQLELSFSETIELLEAHSSVVARRAAKKIKEFSPEDWIKLHYAIKKVFG